MRAIHHPVLVLGLLALAAARGHGDEPAKPVIKPDLIVSDLRIDGADLVLEVQNQGPGVAQKGLTVEATVSGWLVKKEVGADGKVKENRTPAKLTVAVPVPAAVGVVETVTVPLKKFGDAGDFSRGSITTVVLDTKNQLDEQREGNNTYHRQLDGSTVEANRGAYKNATELPDLTITNIVQDGPYLKVEYANIGKGASGADFLIRLRFAKTDFAGNLYYRPRVPAPGTTATTGGLSHNLKAGQEVEVEATIDHEDRVHEADKKNNVYTKKLTVILKK